MKAKTLTIDIGNSRTKVDLWDDNKFVRRQILTSYDSDLVMQLIRRHNVEAAIVCSVRKDSLDFVADIREKGVCYLMDFNREEINKYSGEIRYDGNIGADRVAAYLGARTMLEDTEERNKGCLIVDIGTAMTIDITDSKGFFRGGNISQGLSTRIKWLSDSTSMLPGVGETSSEECFGHDTRTAIICGAVNGIVSEILYAREKAEKEYNIEKIILTGGESDFFAPLLEEEGVSICHDPYLVGRGLNFHLRNLCAQL